MSRCVSSLMLILIVLLAGCGEDPSSLYIYSWAEAFDPNLIEAFEKEFDCKVYLESYDSNEAMYAKLKAISNGYDLINPSSYYVSILQKQKMLEKIDKSLIPNLIQIDEKMLKTLGDTSTYEESVPYVLSYVAVGYRKDKVSPPPTSWEVFGDKNLKGRLTMLDDTREVIGAALLQLGYSPNTTDEAEIELAVKRVLRWKKNLAKFDSIQPRHGIADAEFYAVQMFSKDLIQVMKDEPRVGLAQPKEGTTFSSDHLAIPAGAPHPHLAHAFIDFLLRPENAAQNMRYTGYTCPNLGAYALLEDEIKHNEAYFPPEDFMKKSFLLIDIGEAIKLYHHAWDEIKKG